MAPDDLRSRVLAGATVYMGFADGARVWWFESPYEEIDDATMSVVMKSGNGGPILVEAGDSLFGWIDNSQTWRSAFG